MRRKHKFIIGGILIVGCGVDIADILLQWYESRQAGIKFTWENFNGKRTVKNSLIGGGIGAALGYGYYCYKMSEEESLPFNADEFLKDILREEHIKANPVIFQEMLNQREKIKTWLSNEFGDLLVASPQETGSFAKRTAIGSNYDLDIMLPFKRNSYASLEEMYDDVHERLYKKFGSTGTVEKKSRAIAVTLEKNGEPLFFDIVPGREINNFFQEKDLNLYVRPDSFWKRGGSFKTNIDAQKNMSINKPEARAVIKLLKTYRDRNNLDLPTTVIEQYVVSALSENNYGIDYSPTENLLNSMDYMARKLEQKKLTDIANSNNNLHDKVDNIERSNIVMQLMDDIKKIEQNPRNIKEIFEC